MASKNTALLAYHPLGDKEERSSSSSRFGEDEEDEPMLRQVSGEPARSSPLPWVKSMPGLALACAVVLLCTALVALATAMVLKSGGRSPVSSNVIVDSYQKEVGKYIEYESTVFSQDDYDLDAQFLGEPSDEIDARWHNLLDPQNIGVPADYMGELGRVDEGIRISSGEYFGSFMVFHHLHCIKNLYHNLHPEYYGLADLTPREKDIQIDHLHHCLHLLRQAVMCQADTTLVTMKWGNYNKRPIGNLNAAHRCVRWDRFLEFVEPRSFDAWKETFVHPKFGNPFAGGKSELDLMFHRNRTSA